MGTPEKVNIWNKRIGTLCLLMTLLCLVAFPRGELAAPNTNPLTLTISQTVSKPTGSTVAGTFGYTLTALESSNPLPASAVGDVYSFTISGTDSINIGPINFPTAGTYNYELRVDSSSLSAGHEYDAQVYTISVYVDAFLDVDMVIKNKSGTKSEVMKFENRYAPDPVIMVDPPVRKTVQGTPSEDSTFTFKLEAQNKDNPMPSGSTDGVKTIQITGSGSADFGTWNYTEENVYYYTISEVNGKESSYSYDTEIYTITDVVRDVNGRLELNRTITNSSGKQVEAYIFINTYKGSAVTPTPTPDSASDLTKSSVNSGPKTGDEANITLYLIIMGLSGTAVVSCIAYLVIGRRRRKEAAK